MAEKKEVLVVTDNDYWNAGDGSFFFLVKGQAKPLPEVTTAIIEDALEQKLIREATSQEVEEYKHRLEVEEAIKQRKIKAGDNFKETDENFQKYKNGEKK